MAKGLPLEFELLKDRIVVGYGKFMTDIDYPAFGLRWYTSADGKVWHYGNCVLFDEMRQYTGYKIKKRKVYFGDKLKDGNGPWNILIVEISEDGEMVAANKMFGCYPKDFKEMELTNDTP